MLIFILSLITKLEMIISFKYKFIFIKTYKTASSSIENYLYSYLSNEDIIATTEDYQGINCWGDFDTKDIEDYFGKEFLIKKSKHKLKYFAHMPIWLVKERLKPLSKKLNYDIFKNFFKFGVVRNPFDTIVSHYYWQNNSVNKNAKPITFYDLLKELEANENLNYGLLNLNKLMDKKCNTILCDKIIKYENLNKELDLIFNRLGIPFDGELKIYKKKSNRDNNYRKYFDNKAKILVENIYKRDMEIFDYVF